jgi:DNA-binding MarR family transcriptional regulator
MSNPETREMAQELMQILDRFSRLELEQAPRRDLKPSECRVLGKLFISLDDGKQTIKASELSNQLNITPAGVTHLINPLEEGGYIERLQDPKDRRVVLIGLTDKGKQFAQSLIADANQRLVGLAEHLGEEDSKTFVRLMSAILDYFTTHPTIN